MVTRAWAALLGGLCFTGLPACTPAWFTHYETQGVGELAVGQDQGKVRSAVGEPHHMTKLPEDSGRCVERWEYTDMTRGLLIPNVDTLLVDFDAAQKVCNVDRSKIESTWGGIKMTLPSALASQLSHAAPAPSPAADNPAPSPAVDKPAPSPAADKPAPKPAADKPAPKPAADKPAPKPAADKPAPKPAADKPAPKPAADKPAPKPAESCRSHLDCKAGLVCPHGQCVAPSCTGDKECGAGQWCSLEGACESAKSKPNAR